MPLRELDFYDAKGAVEAALDAVGIKNAGFSAAADQASSSGARRRRSRAYESVVGYVGKLNDEIAAGYKFRQPVYVAELDLDKVLAHAANRHNYRPLPRFPGVVRDVSFVGPREVTYAEIEDVISSKKNELCRNVEFVDVYEGKGLGDDERSITIRLEYLSDERTLTEDEVETAHDNDR